MTAPHPPTGQDGPSSWPRWLPLLVAVIAVVALLALFVGTWPWSGNHHHNTIAPATSTTTSRPTTTSAPPSTTTTQLDTTAMWPYPASATRLASASDAARSFA